MYLYFSTIIIKVIVLVLFRKVFCNVSRMEGWNYINLHCRDNNNKPVDWWYIYKPPRADPLSMEDGRNFSFITPDSNGKWEESAEHINTDSMLKYTLSPMFRRTYSDHLAIFSYHSRKSRDEDPGSYGNGIMLADGQGGFWIGHTLPDFPDLSTYRYFFPENQVPYGHLFVCLSLDLVTLNGFASSLKIIQPNVTRLDIPPNVKENLPNWNNFFRRSNVENHQNDLMKLDFTTSSQVRGSMLLRRPGDTRCLYRAFAMTNSLVLDVYGHDPQFVNTCKSKYSVRNINVISVKYPENRVYYINNQSDYVGFAVNTGAHWQRGGGKDQYWTCTGNPEKEEVNEVRKGKGSLIVCVENYNIWRSFDMLKVKEPEC